MSGSTAVLPAVSAEDIDAAFRLADELAQAGRLDDLRSLLRLIAQQEARQSGASAGVALTPEDAESLERADADIAAGRIVPNDVVMRGHAAVEAYLHRRNAGDVPPEVAAAAAAFRRDLAAVKQAAAGDA
jgi:hypothetical protein